MCDWMSFESQEYDENMRVFHLQIEPTNEEFAREKRLDWYKRLSIKLKIGAIVCILLAILRFKSKTHSNNTQNEHNLWADQSNFVQHDVMTSSAFNLHRWWCLGVKCAKEKLKKNNGSNKSRKRLFFSENRFKERLLLQ